MEGCACWYAIHQPLTAFSEISAHILEIANLGVDPTTTCDSTPPLRLRPHEAYKSLRVFPEGAPSCFLPWCETTTRSHLPSSLCPPVLMRRIMSPPWSMMRPVRWRLACQGQRGKGRGRRW